MSDENAVPIVAEPSASDPHLCRFTADRPFHDGAFRCASAAAAKGSPLLEALFAVPGVRQVHVDGARLTVEKTGDEPWASVGRKIGAALRARLAAGGPLFPDAAAGRRALEDHIRRAVETVLASDINPSLAAHGGRVEVDRVEGTSVRVRMDGGCQGCASARVTMRQGVEKTVREKVPEVTEVVDVTDHAAGRKPYFTAEGASPFAGSN